MDFLKEVILPIILIFVEVFLILLIVVFSVYKYTVEVAEANIVNAYVSEKLVYTGKKAFIDITSGGMTTTLTIYKKLFPFQITDKIYSDNNIKITN